MGKKGNGIKKVTIVILWKRAAWNTGREKCDALEKRKCDALEERERERERGGGGGE